MVPHPATLPVKNRWPSLWSSSLRVVPANTPLQLGSLGGGRIWRSSGGYCDGGGYLGEESFLERLEQWLGEPVAGKRQESHSGGAERCMTNVRRSDW